MEAGVNEVVSASQGSALAGLFPSDETGFGPHPANEPMPDLTPAVGQRIGRYQLNDQIGEGAFGVVFLAQQQSPVVRQVALKVIKAGMDTRAVIARFEAERQALALLDHPGIAKVLDAGQTMLGRPYFVMELVRGLAITRYCDEHRLTLEDRLDLFMSVCRAVQHAHQQGIIHRDLKPANVLVSRDQQGRSVAKVIDFGLAKALHQPLTDKTLHMIASGAVGRTHRRRFCIVCGIASRTRANH
jgi:serine/threonine protein kinase